MKTLIISLFFATLVFSQSSNYDSLAYLTASVGDHIYDHENGQGGGGTTNIPDELTTYNSTNGTDFVITKYRDWTPAGNTLWEWDKCFNDSTGYTFKETFLDTDTFGVIMIKECYASQSDIWAYGSPDDTLNNLTTQRIYNYQWYVRRILTVMESYPNKFFVWWTIPPIVTPGNSEADAARLRWFNKWMVDTLATGIDTSYGAFPQNVYVWDYFEIVDSANWLPFSFADAETDSHPNGACADVAAPLFVEQVFDAILAFDALLANDVWYIDRDVAGGDGSGDSWVNAFASFDDYAEDIIDWNYISAGDTIYISGGTDSTVYTGYQQIMDSVAYFETPVVITPSWETGHNGDVYIMNSDSTLQRNFNIKYVSNLKIVDIIFWTDVPENDAGGGTINVICEYDSLIEFENCTFTNSRTGSALYLGAATKITVTNSTIQTLTNDSEQEMDVLTWGDGGRGGHIFRDNTIIQRNQSPTTDAHRDFIQVGSGNWGDAEMLETVFDGNFMWCLRPLAGGAWNQGFYMGNATPSSHIQRFLFVNNIMIIDVDENTVGGFAINNPTPTSASVSFRLYNNTIITDYTTFYSNATDTLIAKNNIFIQKDNAANRKALYLHRDAYIDMDYNYYSLVNWDSDTERFYTNYVGYNTGYNFGEWQAEGYDVNSDSGSTSLTSVLDSVVSAYYTTTGRDVGVDLTSECPEALYDILGNSRSGSWDMGALQFNGDKWLRSSNGRRIFSSDGKSIIMADE